MDAPHDAQAEQVEAPRTPTSPRTDVEQGIGSLDQVDYCVLETDGTFSFPRSSRGGS